MIKTMKDKVEASCYAHQYNAFLLGLNELVSYLESDKFAEDTKVEVKDVITRLEEIRSVGSDAWYNTLNDWRKRMPQWWGVEYGDKGVASLDGRKVWFEMTEPGLVLYQYRNGEGGTVGVDRLKNILLDWECVQ